MPTVAGRPPGAAGGGPELPSGAMGLPTGKLGTDYGVRLETVDDDRARAFAAATNDTAGRHAPPVFAVVPTWSSLTAALAGVLPAGSLPWIVHSAQDMHFHQALAPGRRLATRARAFNVRPGRTGARYTVHLASVDGDTGEPVLDQYATMLVRGLAGGEPSGPDAPDHAFPAAARALPVGEHTVTVDADQAVRYGQASGDHNPIHLDDEAARAVGLPGAILHGLCTMAMVGRSVVALVAGGDPDRLRRLAVRFAGVVRPGHDLVTTAYDGGTRDGRRIHPFETISDGRLVVSHGRAEVG